MNPQHLCMGCMTDHGGAPVCPQCGYQEEQPVTGGGLYLPPRTLLNERYLIGRLLGEGGFGITYLAYDLTLTLKLAVKEFLPRGFATRAADGITVSAYQDVAQSEVRQVFTHGLEKFLEEAQILARFSEYPGIVAVRDFFTANGTGYLVMSYLDGMTLRQHVAAQGGRLPFSQAFQLLSPVMDALQKVHAAGLAHRDISPDNIYITRDQQVKLIDFGAARFALMENGHSLSVIFKRGFAPMEQYHTHGQQGPWTDVYALAGTLYYAVTGQAPPEAPVRGLDDPLQPPSALGVEMPGTTEAVLLKGLAVRVELRYRTIEAFQQDLARVAVDEDKTQVFPARPAVPARPGKLLPDPLFLHEESPPEKNPPETDIGPSNRHRLVKGLGIAVPMLLIAALLAIPRSQDSADSPTIPPPLVKDAPPAPEPPVGPFAVTPATTIPKTRLIQLDTPRGTTPVYHVGERLELMAQVSDDGYLYCYYRDESGNIARIYPNRYALDSYLRAGQRIDIPGPNAGFSIEFTEADQRPEVLCLASKRDLGAKLPASLKVADLEPVSVASLETVVQVFQVLDRDSLSYARLRLTVLKK